MIRDLFEFFEEIFLPTICFIFGLMIISVLISLPINYYSTKSKIAEFNATKITIQQARNNKNITEIESAALQHKIVEINQWLANVQYWKHTVFDWWIPDEIDKLEPLK